MTRAKRMNALFYGLMLLMMITACSRKPADTPAVPDDLPAEVIGDTDDGKWSVTDGDRLRDEQTWVNFMVWKEQDPSKCNELENKTFESGKTLEGTALKNLPLEIGRCKKYFYSTRAAIDRDSAPCEKLSGEYRDECLRIYELVKGLPAGRLSEDDLRAVCPSGDQERRECMGILARDPSYCKRECSGDESCIIKTNNCVIFSSDPKILSISMLTSPVK